MEEEKPSDFLAISMYVQLSILFWCNQSLEQEKLQFHRCSEFLAQLFFHRNTEILQLGIYQNCAKGAKELKPRCMLRMGS